MTTPLRKHVRQVCAENAEQLRQQISDLERDPQGFTPQDARDDVTGEVLARLRAALAEYERLLARPE